MYWYEVTSRHHNTIFFPWSSKMFKHPKRYILNSKYSAFHLVVHFCRWCRSRILCIYAIYLLYAVITVLVQFGPISFWNPSAIDSRRNPPTSGCYLYYINHAISRKKVAPLGRTRCTRIILTIILWYQLLIWPERQRSNIITDAIKLIKGPERFRSLWGSTERL